MNNVNTTEDLLGFGVWAAGLPALGRLWEEHLEQGQDCRWIACLNPHSYVTALDDAPFLCALQQADWLLPDGVGIVLASRWQRGRICSRITGFDAFSSINRMLDRREGRVFFLGASESTLDLICQRMARDYPHVHLVGRLSPPFKASFSDDDVAQMLAAINNSGADVLWVAMTAPKQEKWIQAHAAQLDVKLIGAVGAVFDFYAGTVKRSPPIFQRLGLEWLPRVVRAPRRLWRRMLVSAPIFVWHAMKAALQRR